MKKLNVLILIFSYIIPSYSNAIELINDNEMKKFEEIESKLNIAKLSLEINDKIAEQKKNEYAQILLLKKIETKEHNYGVLVASLPEKILTSKSGTDGNYFKEIESNIKEIDSLKQESSTLASNNLKIQQDISEMTKLLNDTVFQKNEQIYSLKSEIINRIMTELANPESVRQFNVENSISCSKNQSIGDCLKDTQKFIIKNATSSDPFINEKSTLISYKVTDASMNLEGLLNYKSTIIIKLSYDKNIEKLINEKLGLESAIIKLTSNVNADWFIDGVLVGTGKEITPEVTLGKHGIIASYNKDKKSTIEIIAGNETLNYNFTN
ncbi:hypothetical protein L9G16_04210 [Shewanella sp. A25]|nr:hypothetical protein [Shewanella shenzhenensis]